MSDDYRHCPFCGSAVEKGTQFCQNCGASLTGIDEVTPSSQPVSYGSQNQQSYQQPAYPQQPTYYQQPSTVYYQKSQDNSLGVLSMIFGLLGCFAIPFIGSLVAIITGHMSLSKGKNTYAIVGLILGYLVIIGGIIGIILAFLPIFWY
ncbi:MAG: hypothetical protein FK734_12290 [Asgard group archaeon]|nr:hypothetical protein [Asgard group archaeon]